MLELTVGRFADRIDRCQKDRTEFLHGLQEDIRSYVGPHFRRGRVGLDEDEMGDPHNMAFLFVAVWLGRIVFGTPQVDITTTRIGREQEDARASEMYVNRWARQTKMRLENEQLGIDYLFRFGATVTTFEPHPGFGDWEDPPYMPVRQRVPPEHFLYDAQTRDRSRWRFMGHEFRRDLDDVIREAKEHPESGWNLDLLENMDRDGFVLPDLFGLLADEDRREIEMREIWVPEVTADDLRRLGFDVPKRDPDGREYTARNGYHGAIFTLGAWQSGGDASDEWIREPRMFWGHRNGPYTFYGGYFVGNDAMPLSMIQGTKAQSEHLNTLARARQEAVESYKRVTVVAADDPVLAQVIQNSRNGETLPVETVSDLLNRYAVVEVGGDPNNTMLAAEMAALKIVEMATGMAESQRGEVAPNATATSVATASQATDTRIGMLALKFREPVAEDMEKVAWYGWHSHRVMSELPNGAFYLGGEDRGEALRFARKFHPDRVVGAMPVPTPEGVVKVPVKMRQIPDRELDRWSKEDRARLRERFEDPFDSLDFVVQPYSMEKTPETVQTQQVQTILHLLQILPPMMRAAPEHNWEEAVAMLAQHMNLPMLPSILNVAASKQIGAMQMAMAMAQAGGEGGQEGGAQAPEPKGMVSQPRFGFDQGPYQGAMARGGGPFSGSMTGSQATGPPSRNGAQPAPQTSGAM